jgi:hypothetical protein
MKVINSMFCANRLLCKIDTRPDTSICRVDTRFDTPKNRLFTGLIPLIPQLRARTRDALMVINKNANHISREAINAFMGIRGINVVFMHLAGVSGRVSMGYQQASKLKRKFK